jgi:hypothetical protein
VGGGKEIIDRVQWYRGLERLPAGTAKVVLVPKDSRGPRLISAEPLEYQWIQQGVGRSIVAHLEAHHLTKGRVNFTHQEVNRRLAQESSATLELATLDLKDASDRVSLELVRRVFKNTPELVRALEAIRTDATLLPDGRVQSLKKFAPMGSAVCFPVEAFVFWAILTASIPCDKASSDAGGEARACLRGRFDRSYGTRSGVHHGFGVCWPPCQRFEVVH